MALDYTQQAWRRIRELEGLFHLPRHMMVSVGAAVVASLVGNLFHRYQRRRGADGGGRLVDRALHVAVDMADDIYGVVSSVRKSGSLSFDTLKGAMISALEGSLFSSSIHQVMEGVLGAETNGRFDLARFSGGVAGFAATVATMSLIGGYYEYRALHNEDYVRQLLQKPGMPERVSEALAKRLAVDRSGARTLQQVTSADRTLLAKAIGDVHSYSLASVAIAGLLVAPVVGAFVESMLRWTRDRVQSAEPKHQVLESPGGKQTRRQMDLPYNPESPPNAGLVAWSGLGKQVMTSVVHSRMPLGAVFSEMVGAVRSAGSVVRTVPLPKPDPGVDYRIVMRDTPLRRTPLLRKLERKLALEV